MKFNQIRETNFLLLSTITEKIINLNKNEKINIEDNRVKEILKNSIFLLVSDSTRVGRSLKDTLKLLEELEIIKIEENSSELEILSKKKRYLKR